MSDKYKFNVFTNKLDLVEHIPQLTDDPASPRIEDAWVRRTGSGLTGGGIIKGWIGLGSTPILTTGSGGSFTYELSYRTQEGTTVRATLS